MADSGAGRFFSIAGYNKGGINQSCIYPKIGRTWYYVVVFAMIISSCSSLHILDNHIFSN